MLHCRFFDTLVSRYSSSPSAILIVMLALSNSTNDYVPAQAEVKWMRRVTWSDVLKATGLARCDCRAGEGESVESNEGL